MRVRDLMTKSVVTCEPHSTLDVAARIMWEEDCGAVPVVDPNGAGRVLGMLTDRDIAMAAYLQGRRLAEIRASQVMSTSLVTCKPDDMVEIAEQRMAEGQVRRLPVVDDGGRLVGLFSIAHLARVARQGMTSPELSADVGATLSRICMPRHADARAT